jgi:hypothetical protein
VKTLHVAPNLTNSFAPWRRLPLLQSAERALAFEGLGQFVVYVPARNGGVLEVGCEQADAKIVVRHPRPDSASLEDLAGIAIRPTNRFVYAVRPDEYQWFYVFVGNVTSTYSVWATFTEVGLAREEGGNEDSDPLVPWNFWYFPNAASHRDLSAWGSEKLRPCQKYERVFGRPGVLTWEKEHHNDPAGDTPAWVGHCHNSAPASVLFEEPPAEGLTLEGQHFSCEELKFFATEFFGLYRAWEPEGWGLPGTGRLGRRGPYHERKPAVDSARFGKVVGDFHNVLVSQLLKKNNALMVDLRDATGSDHAEVWNQAVYKYEARMWEHPTLGDWLDIELETRLFANEDTIPEDASSSGRPANIVARGPRGGGKPKDVEPNAAQPGRDQVLRYRVVYDPNGAIQVNNARNEWSSVVKAGESVELHAPRFIFVPAKPLGSLVDQHNGNILLERADILRLVTLRSRFQ